MRKLMTQTAVLSATIALCACASTTQDNDNQAVALTRCAIQQTIPGAKATGAFLNISKETETPLSLVAAKAPSITEHVEIHEMVMNNGMMKMQKLLEYPLAKGDNIFKKGGYHIMLMGLDKTLKAGETHELLLFFNDGSSKTCVAEVKSVEALTPKHMKSMKK